MSRTQRSRTVDASPDAVWRVLADFGGLAAWVPTVDHSCLLSAQTDGDGTVRRVQFGPQTLVERVVTWRPSDELAYTIEGLPIVEPPTTTWRIQTNGHGSEVTVSTEIDRHRNPAKAVVAGRVLARMGDAADDMLAALADHLVPEPESNPASASDTEETDS